VSGQADSPAPYGADIAAGYLDWVHVHDTLTDVDRVVIRGEIARLPDPPQISLLLPLGFASPLLLRHTLAAIHEQLYPHWELCVAGVPRQAPQGADRVAASFAAHDPRIRIADRAPHGDRATAANAALAEATGDFVALLAEGDRLPPHALFEVAATLALHRDTELLYTDEDLIDEGNFRSAPRFKTGWDPDLLLAYDYIGGLAVYRREAVLAAGGLRPGFGGAVGYDLALRATAAIRPDRIRHLPSVLFRRPAAGPSLNDRMLGDDAAAARRAVIEFLGPDARISPAPLVPTCNRVTWPVPSPAPLVSVIMPTRDHPWLFGPAAWGVLLRTDYPALELLIVDNDSVEEATEPTLRDLAADRRVRILRQPGPFNFSALNNIAVREAAGEIIVLLNNDVNVMQPCWLSELVGHAVRPEVGAVGAKLFYADGRVQHAGVVLGPGLNATHILRLAERLDPGYEGQLALTRNFSAVTGACLAMRRAVYLEVGGLDEVRFAVAFNDIDLCLRLGEHGYRVVWTPFAELFHLESQSRGTADTPDKLEVAVRETDHLWRQWRHAFDSDPFHSPNLSCKWHVPLHLTAPRRARPWQRDAAA
jgi:GT2 family glycosyltransferase